jgi:polyhydroxyalkanoate synthesis repressor PhaR
VTKKKKRKTMADNAAVHAAESEAAATQQAPVVVKKYANRRLYNTETSSYVTLEDLAGMVRGGRDFAVYDAKSGEDITRSVLTQIIVEEESKGRSLLPESFLRHLIGFYGDSLQTVLPRYLDLAMAGFARQQEQMRRSVEQAMGMGGFLPFGGLEEMGKQQKAMVERAMSLFSPFRPPEPPAPSPSPSPSPSVEDLQVEIESLKRQLDALRGTAGSPPR